MSFTEKMAVLDLMIEILKEQENRLDELAACIDQIDVEVSVPPPIEHSDDDQDKA